MMLSYSSPKEKGFSLIEVVLGLGVTLILLLGSGMFIAEAVKQSKVSGEKISSSQYFIIINRLVRKNFDFVNIKNIDPTETFEASSSITPSVSSDYGKTTLASSLLSQKPLIRLNVEASVVSAIASARPALASILTGTVLPIYTSSSVLGRTSFKEGVPDVQKSSSQVILSRCLTQSEIEVLGGTVSESTFADVLYVKRWAPVVTSSGKGKVVRCCKNDGVNLTCDANNSTQRRPVVITALIDENLKLSGMSYFPNENDSSKGSGFFFHFDKSVVGRTLARINTFSMFDQCKTSSTHCEKALGDNFIEYRVKSFTWVSPLVSALESTSIFSLE